MTWATAHAPLIYAACGLSVAGAFAMKSRENRARRDAARRSQEQHQALLGRGPQQ